MKKFFFYFIAIIFAFTPLSLFAQTASSNLSLLSVDAKNQTEIELIFNKNIKIDSLRVTVENQNTRELLPVKQYFSTVDEKIARVQLEKELLTSSPYRLTVNTATATDGNSISTGVDAVREFVTPAVFNNDFIELEAPSNPTLPTTNTIPTQNPEPTIVPENPKVEPETNKEAQTKTPLENEKVLPATGLEFTIFLLTSGLLGMMFAFAARKKM